MNKSRVSPVKVLPKNVKNPKNLKFKKSKNHRQNSLLTIATGTSSRYYNTTRQTEGKSKNLGRFGLLNGI